MGRNWGRDGSRSSILSKHVTKHIKTNTIVHNVCIKTNYPLSKIPTNGCAHIDHKKTQWYLVIKKKWL